MSGLRDHFSHCDRNCRPTPTKIARNLYIADAVMNVAHRIIDDFGVSHVTVCSVLHITYPYLINADIDAYNNVLGHFCYVETNIDYHTHRGFWQRPMSHCPERTFIRPNSVIGRRKYKRWRSLAYASWCYRGATS